MKKKVVIFGPGPQFKGGMANYTTSLAKAFDKLDGVETHIVSWTQQYPAIIPRDFLDKNSKIDQLEGTNVKVRYITNYNNPFTWNSTYKYIKSLNPTLVIFQWSIALQGLPLGYIAKKLRKHTEVVFDLHFVIQKEQSKIDLAFTKLGISQAHTYVVHAQKTADELSKLYPGKKFLINDTGKRDNENTTVIKLYHPVYDMFKPDANFNISAFKQELGLKKHVFLFFGFIRKYKGLHYCIEAFARLAKQREDVSLLIVGESFWQTLDSSKFSTKIKKIVFGFAKAILTDNKTNEDDYRPLDLIKKHNIEHLVTTINDYVPNEEVYKYFQVSDCILLFYEYATPSGVESMAYNFNMPMLATSVGHFPETISDGYNGYLAKAKDVNSMAQKMNQFIEKPISPKNIAETAKKMSWENYAKAILNR